MTNGVRIDIIGLSLIRIVRLRVAVAVRVNGAVKGVRRRNTHSDKGERGRLGEEHGVMGMARASTIRYYLLCICSFVRLPVSNDWVASDGDDDWPGKGRRANRKMEKKEKEHIENT